MDWKRFRNLCVTEIQSLLREYTEIRNRALMVEQDQDFEVAFDWSCESCESIQEEGKSSNIGLEVQNVSI